MVKHQIRRPSEITGSRVKLDGKTEYLIKWDDKDKGEESILLETWEPEVHLSKCHAMIEEYKKDTKKKEKEIRKKKRDERILRQQKLLKEHQKNNIRSEK